MQIHAQDITVKFGEFAALSDLTFTAEPSGVTAIIGPNGAGKTTLLNVLSGLQIPVSGYVTLDGDRVEPWQPRRLWQLGVSRTFQLPRLFDELTVKDNVAVGVRTAAHGFGPRRLRRVTEFAGLCLEKLGGGDIAQKRIADLTFAEQRLVELARALACEPSLLLLDEPSAGVAIDDARHLLKLAVEYLPKDASIILVSHDVPLVFELAARIVVLEFGRCIAEGDPKMIGQDARVRTAYLGENIDEAEKEMAEKESALGAL